jgi:hypothetical protein
MCFSDGITSLLVNAFRMRRSHRPYHSAHRPVGRPKGCGYVAGHFAELTRRYWNADGRPGPTFRRIVSGMRVERSFWILPTEWSYDEDIFRYFCPSYRGAHARSGRTSRPFHLDFSSCAHCAQGQSADTDRMPVRFPLSARQQSMIFKSLLFPPQAAPAATIGRKRKPYQ